MSFIITMYVREGIVMASDSRLTLSTQTEQDDRRVVNLSVGFSDSNYKTFLAPNHIGISTFGAADISGVPIAGFIDSFINEVLGAAGAPVDDVAQKLLVHFRAFDPVPAVSFHVAGYFQEPDGRRYQRVWAVNVGQNQVQRLNPQGQPGASWGGEADILARLVQPVAQVDEKGSVVQKLAHFPIPWQFYTLQDAIDFCVFAVRSTIDAIRFQPRAKTVGGPIDVLVIKPDGAVWIQRKRLHGTDAA